MMRRLTLEVDNEEEVPTKKKALEEVPAKKKALETLQEARRAVCEVETALPSKVEKGAGEVIAKAMHKLSDALSALNVLVNELVYDRGRSQKQPVRKMATCNCYHESLKLGTVSS